MDEKKESDEEKLSRERKEYLRKWLEREQKTHEASFEVQKYYELAEWQHNALKARPEESYEIPINQLIESMEIENQYIYSYLPMLPELGNEIMFVLSASSTSTSSGTYEYVTRVGDIETDDAQDYSANHVKRYLELQETHKIPAIVRKFIEELEDKNTLDRFDRANKAMLSVRSGAGERTSAASDIRSLLYGIQGDLFKKASKWKGDNMNWEIMSDRLSMDKTDSYTNHELKKQGEVFSSLVDRLSKIMKEYEGKSLTNLDHIWTQTLDHINTVLNLIKASNS